jgi:hypothetical protein
MSALAASFWHLLVVFIIYVPWWLFRFYDFVPSSKELHCYPSRTLNQIIYLFLTYCQQSSLILFNNSNSQTQSGCVVLFLITIPLLINSLYLLLIIYSIRTKLASVG